jgi:WD40 repeat protein
VESGKILQKLAAHTDHVLYAAFSPDGKKIVTAIPG